MRYLGIDYGTKKIGLALSDEAGTMGFPHTVIPNNEKVLETVQNILTQESVGAVVIGDSLDSSGVPNPVQHAAREFAHQLKEKSGIPVFFEIEMFTTQEARRALDGTHPQHISDSARKRPRKETYAVDASAAALILTSYLSRTHGND